MTLKNYLIVMSVLTTMCWAVFALMLNIINPETTNYLGFSLFYFSLFLSLAGTIALVGFIFRFIALRRSLVFQSVRNAFRQSFLFALFIVISLGLLASDLFTWLNVILLLIIFIVLELFVSSYRRVK